jgi:argininosuccinate lyase
VIELCSALAIISMHLSRFSEEIILWNSWEFKFIELSDAFSTGSSIMPQKKNPDIAELVRGKTGRVYGDLTALLTMMKSLPLSYDKDMQEDKEAIFDALETVKDCLAVFRPMLEEAGVNKDNMYKAASKGFINATDLADYLTLKGVSFRAAYEIVGKLVALCVSEGFTLENLPFEVYKKYHGAFESDVYAYIDLKNCVERRNSEGGTAEKNVKVSINIAKKWIKA